VTGLSCPWGAVSCRIMLARQIGWQCRSVRLPVTVALGAVPAGFRFRRGRALGTALRVGGGLPPRRCACIVSCAPVCARAQAVPVAAAASRIARRIRGLSHSAAAAAASAAVRRAAAAAFSATGLPVCHGRSSVTRRLISSSGSAAANSAEALAALAGLSLPSGLVRAVRFTTGRKDRSLLITASA
jgi:hypothetical protein